MGGVTSVALRRDGILVLRVDLITVRRGAVIENVRFSGSVLTAERKQMVLLRLC